MIENCIRLIPHEDNDAGLPIRQARCEVDVILHDEGVKAKQHIWELAVEDRQERIVVAAAVYRGPEHAGRDLNCWMQRLLLGLHVLENYAKVR